jgi:hypothetical protein
MFEGKPNRLPIDEKHSRSTHALVDRNLLKSMQSDINSASSVISSLREEKEKLRKSLQQLQQDNHEKNNLIRSLKNKIKQLETAEEEDDVVKSLNQANLKLKNEIELSMHGIVHKNSEQINEIIALTEVFLNKVHDKTRMYQIFKSHMKSSNHFKQVIGNENWSCSTLMLLRFFKDFCTDDENRVKIVCPEKPSDDESEQENYTKVIQDSKHLLDTLSYQKNKLEHLNQEFSGRNKVSPGGSPIYRNLNGNLTSDKILMSPELRKDGQITSFHTANKLLKNYSKFKSSKK